MSTYPQTGLVKLKSFSDKSPLILIDTPRSVSTSKFATFPPITVGACLRTTKKGEALSIFMTPIDALRTRDAWRDKEYRNSYAEAAVEQGIAWQIKTNRERRGLSQEELARSVHTRQSAVSRMEDPEYGCHSLKELMKIASVFDCALVVKFAAYSVLAMESEHLSPDDLYAPGYVEEIGDE